MPYNSNSNITEGKMVDIYSPKPLRNRKYNKWTSDFLDWSYTHFILTDDFQI